MLRSFELGDAVRLGPNTDLARFEEGVVPDGEEPPAVVDDGGLGAMELDAELGG